MNSNKKPGIVLSFDYGLRQIGVAVGESLTKSVRPLSIINARDGVPNWAEIEAVISEFKPAFMVVGLPLNMDGTESEMSQRARKVRARLHGRFGLEVLLEDERLSSKEAKQALRERQSGLNKSGSTRKKNACIR